MTDAAKIDDGGPVFPCEGGEFSGLHPDPGMSLRDYFAAMPLSDYEIEMLRAQYEHARPGLEKYNIQDLRWFHASRMLAARRSGGAP